MSYHTQEGCSGCDNPYHIHINDEDAFRVIFDVVAKASAKTAAEKGFVTELANVPEKLCLIHSEVSEALEAFRNGNPPDDKLPSYDGLTVELADAVIRIASLAGALGLNVGAAVVDKMRYNATRSFRHGGKKF